MTDAIGPHTLPRVNPKRFSPAQQLVLTFLAVILLGTILLALPQASTSGRSIGITDALFTATSATCVTGLIVRDTPQEFTTFGLVVLLTLIQIGGLGIMTFSMLFAQMFGADLSLDQRALVREDTGAQSMGAVGDALRQIAFWVLLVETLGAALLVIYYRSQDVTGSKAFGYAFFHSISAFCNAGFALYSDSLVGFADSEPFNLVISALILLGGLGFGVLSEISRALVRRAQAAWKSQPAPTITFSTHAKTVFCVTLVLWLGGTLFFWIAERNHTLASSGFKGDLLRASFLSVTARTAGFNTVPIEALSAAGVWLMVGLMFIGASPGGTGGGLKTTTVAVLFAALRQELRGGDQVIFWSRQIPEDLIKRSLALLSCFVIFTAASTFALALVEPFRLDEIFFEAVSALGTVGLSMGITGKLSQTGKLIITVLMFAGRLGPMTLLLGLRTQSVRGSMVRYPLERDLAIG